MRAFSSSCVASHLRDELAGILIKLSEAPGFWYTVNPETSYYGFSLCSRLGMIPRDYASLLLAAGFAKLKAGRVILNDVEWRAYIEGGDFIHLENNRKIQCNNKTCDVIALSNGTKPDRGKRKTLYCTKIGRTTDRCFYDSLLHQTDMNGKLIQHPPKIASLGSKQRQFVRNVLPSIIEAIRDNEILYSFIMDNDNDTEHASIKSKNNKRNTDTLLSPPPTKRIKLVDNVDSDVNVLTPSPERSSSGIDASKFPLLHKVYSVLGNELENEQNKKKLFLELAQILKEGNVVHSIDRFNIKSKHGCTYP